MAELILDDAAYREILDNFSEGVYFLDPDRVITYWNKGAEKITGYSSAEAVGKSCADNLLVHVDEQGRPLCLEGCPMAATMDDGLERSAEVFLHHKEGHRVAVKVTSMPLFNEKGDVMGAVEIFSDNSGKVAALEQIRELQKATLTDGLTGIGNRVYCEMTLENRLSEFRRYGWRFGVLFLDIDHFKDINDQYGHSAGDRVLRMVARTLSSSIRNFDFLGRWGGEEFLAVLAQVDEDLLRRVAERTRVLVERSFSRHQGRVISPTVSIGGTIVRQGDTIEDIVARADGLMYQSKENGRNRVTLDV